MDWLFGLRLSGSLIHFGNLYAAQISSPCPCFEPLSHHNVDVQWSRAREKILSLACKITKRCVAAYLFLCFCACGKGGGERRLNTTSKSVHDRNITKLDVSNPSGIWISLEWIGPQMSRCFWGKKRFWYNALQSVNNNPQWEIIQRGKKRASLPEEDASEIWDVTFSITNNERVPLSAGNLLGNCITFMA